jgi:hypothetical protein
VVKVLRYKSEKSCRENQNTYFTLKKISENRTDFEIMWKNMLQPERLQMEDNRKFKLFILDNQGYRKIFIIFNTYCFSTAKLVTGTRINITLYVHCPSF